MPRTSALGPCRDPPRDPGRSSSRSTPRASAAPTCTSSTTSSRATRPWSWATRSPAAWLRRARVPRSTSASESPRRPTSTPAIAVTPVVSGRRNLCLAAPLHRLARQRRLRALRARAGTQPPRGPRVRRRARRRPLRTALVRHPVPLRSGRGLPWRQRAGGRPGSDGHPQRAGPALAGRRGHRLRHARRPEAPRDRRLAGARRRGGGRAWPA